MRSEEHLSGYLRILGRFETRRIPIKFVVVFGSSDAAQATYCDKAMLGQLLWYLGIGLRTAKSLAASMGGKVGN